MALLRLHGKTQNYPWGRDGSESLAALMGANGVADFPGIDESKPYAELWMGTHPNGPATLADEPSKSLSQHLSENRHLLGAAQRFPVVVSEPTDAHVPFLFKILTCKQALPLQIHPSKELAAKLHEEDPEQFKDINHKPEIAVAITDFKGFAGFRPIDRTLASIKAVPEVAELFEREASVKGHYAALQSDATPDNLRQLFGAVLALPSSATEATVREVIKRVKADGAEALGDAPDADVLAMVLEKLESQYGSDPAVLVASLFMNLMQLKAGEGAYVPADEAHAWLEGTIVELMAASDNVLNVGFMDDDEKNSVALVTRVLSCTPRPADGFRLETHAWDKASSGKTIAFDTPFEEFAMCQTPRMDVHEEIGPLSGPLIGVVTSDTKGVIELVGGEDAAQTIESARGTIVFLAAGHKMRVGPGQEFSAAYYDGE